MIHETNDFERTDSVTLSLSNLSVTRAEDDVDGTFEHVQGFVPGWI